MCRLLHLSPLVLSLLSHPAYLQVALVRRACDPHQGCISVPIHYIGVGFVVLNNQPMSDKRSRHTYKPRGADKRQCTERWREEAHALFRLYETKHIRHTNFLIISFGKSWHVWRLIRNRDGDIKIFQSPADPPATHTHTRTTRYFAIFSSPRSAT